MEANDDVEDIEDHEEDRIMYSTDGAGYWIKRVWKRQCPDEVFLHGRCQGIEGHEGVHWCYSPCGSFCWSENENDPTIDKTDKRRGVAGSTPPGHEKYKNPIDMMDAYYVSNYEDSEVTDPELIARLEADDEDIQGSINRPVREEELKWLQEEDRI
jgi:hypothetical protein